ncbi:hypothetical protein QY97_02681 [Bacillus thermotolerans]|nr:hypothetical protein QY97_02681 [Bacillus thermotolerans]
MNRRIRNRTYGGVRGAKIINLFSLYSILREAFMYEKEMVMADHL